MKIAHGHGLKLLGRMAVALALGAAATAQHLAPSSGAGSLGNDIRGGGNLGNDIREGHGPRRALELADGGSVQVDLGSADAGLQLAYEVIPLDGSDLGALFPARSDMRNRLRLSGGIAGQIVVIEVELSSMVSGGQGARRTLARGVIGADGTFEVDIPPSADLKGTRARASMLDGRVVTEQVAVELEPAAEEAFISWQVLGKLDRPRGAHHGDGSSRVRRATVPPRPIR